jgi:hypothetical protein
MAYRAAYMFTEKLLKFLRFLILPSKLLCLSLPSTKHCGRRTKYRKCCLQLVVIGSTG